MSSEMTFYRGYPGGPGWPTVNIAEKFSLTWFWMRSLIRSMGAAAVLETAAETPPTVAIVSSSSGMMLCISRLSDKLAETGELIGAKRRSRDQLNVLRKSAMKG